jgi:hypothetical protein
LFKDLILWKIREQEGRTGSAQKGRDAQTVYAHVTKCKNDKKQYKTQKNQNPTKNSYFLTKTKQNIVSLSLYKPTRNLGLLWLPRFFLFSLFICAYIV